MSIEEHGFANLRAQIDRRLDELLPPETAVPQNLHRAIRYSALAPGKRLRGILALLAAKARPGAETFALDFACAIETVHVASLIVDDLPIMDDAIMRRGQPATHRVFGEDTATLAAFALLSQAYDMLAGADGLAPALRLELVRLLHGAVGTAGLTGGQELDLHEDLTASSIAGVSDMYHLKTGVLFVAAAAGGARIGGLTGPTLQAVLSYARYVGLAYQLADDLADGARMRAGTQPGVVALLGRPRSERLLAQLLEEARHKIAALGPVGTPLAAFLGHVFNTATFHTPRAVQTASA